MSAKCELSFTKLVKQEWKEPDAVNRSTHGKWIKADSQQYFRKRYPLFTCSVCGYKKDSQKKWNYCPNCGAKMKKEGKRNDN